MWEMLIASHDLGRVQALAAILIRYGFGDMVRRLGLAQALARAGKTAAGAPAAPQKPERPGAVRDKPAGTAAQRVSLRNTVIISPMAASPSPRCTA